MGKKEEVRVPAPKELLEPAVEFEKAVYQFHVAPLKAAGVAVPEEPPIPGPATLLARITEGKSPLSLLEGKGKTIPEKKAEEAKEAAEEGGM